MPSDFAGAFAALRAMLSRHAADMIVQADTPTTYAVASRALGPDNKPLWFGAVMLKKSAVTYHLMPLYFNPALQAAVPPELLRRKQGKTCFNFQRPDPDLFGQLDVLTRVARDQWARHGFLDPRPISREQLDAALRACGEDPEALAGLRPSQGRQASAKRAAPLKGKAAKAGLARPKTR